MKDKMHFLFILFTLAVTCLGDIPCIVFSAYLIALINCQLSSSPTTVSSTGTLTITATYSMPTTSATITFYLSISNIVAFFPSGISCSVVLSYYNFKNRVHV